MCSSDLLDKILPLVGVLIGLWLGPMFANRIQNRNNKNALKAELIQSIYLFFNYRKAGYGATIRSNYNSEMARRAWDKLKNVEQSLEMRNENERQFSVVKNNADKEESRSNEYFDKLIEIEAIMLKQLTDIQRFYGNETYNAVSKLIQPHLDESNSSFLSDIGSMTNVDEKSNTYDIIEKLDNELTKKGDELIQKVKAKIII